MAVSTPILGLAVLAYMMVVFYLGWVGYKQTKDNDDYMLAGRKVNPFVLAFSYGAAFISTSAIIGFGGYAGAFGLGILWL
ncbi:MAG: solute:Na+ symporter, family, partial [Methanolobus sp.]|nr:solute:Na+ symporter, family [Methanolobus sp.]